MLEKISAALGTLVFVFILFSSWSPIELRPTTDLGQGWEHIAAFALLGGCWGFTFPRHAFRLMVILMLAAMLSEAGQLFAPGRHARLIDVATKIAGAAIGVAIGRRISDLFR